MEALDPDMANRLAARLSDLLAEATTEKREARDKAAREAARRETLPGRLWVILAKQGTSVSLIVTILSGIVAGAWSVKRYLDQQKVESAQRQREYEFEQRRTIASFAGDLSDSAKRNGAAYALATVAGEAAIPLLLAHLRAAAENDEPFRDALALALSEIGEPVLVHVVRLNREGTDPQGFTTKPTVMATQQIIVSLMERRTPALLDSTPRLNGVVLPSPDLGYRTLDQLNLSGIKFRKVDFCGASLQGTNLRQAEIIESARFMNARLRGADMREIHARSEYAASGVDFEGADLTDANLSGAKLPRADFRRSSLVRTNLTGADLQGADLSFANLTDSD